MNIVSIGDLSQQLSRQTNARVLKSKINMLGQQLVTERTTDPVGHLNGDLGLWNSLNINLRKSSAYLSASHEAKTTLSAMQTVLGTLQQNIAVTAQRLLELDSQLSTMHTTISQEATTAFEQSVNALNQSIANHSLFAGSAVDQTALLSGEDILQHLRTHVETLTTFEEADAAIDQWFADDGAFGSIAYQGTAGHSINYRISEQENLNIPITAEHRAIRSALAAMAKAALAADLSDDQAVAWLRTTRDEAMNSSTDVITLQGEVGQFEEQVDRALAYNAAQSTSYQMTLQNLLGIDSYKSATELQQTQTQLETLFRITARLSDLSLAKFL